jgi:hypothetical protein
LEYQKREALEAEDISAARDGPHLMLDDPIELRPAKDGPQGIVKTGMAAGVRSGTLQVVINLAA